MRAETAAEFMLVLSGLARHASWMTEIEEIPTRIEIDETGLVAVHDIKGKTVRRHHLWSDLWQGTDWLAEHMTEGARRLRDRE